MRRPSNLIILHDEVSAYAYREMQQRLNFIDNFFIETVPPLHLKILKRLPILKHLFGYTIAYYEDDRDRVSILRHGKMLATRRYKRT